MSKQVEDIYKKVTQVEHVLLRPDTYIGSVELTQADMRVYDSENGQIVQREIEMSQGLYKIFDEILVNAADNYQRDRSMKELKVKVKETEIVVENDGRGIPVVIHKQQQVYVPELIFGHLLTSSNYDDSVKKVTGGRNGFGAKLTNIFSRKFTLETADKYKLFKMTWRSNMHEHDEAEVKESGGKQFTRVSFEPDFKRFQMKHFHEDMVKLLSKRVVDMAAVLGPHVKVYLNNERIKVSSFNEYVKLYNIEKCAQDSYESPEGRVWNVGVAASDGQFQQVSFVNSINTVRGGTHVNHVADQIVEGIAQHIKKKYKDFKTIKPFQVKSHLMIFLNCLIDNPAFDSQTKETLTTKPAAFGSSYVISNKFLEEIIKKTPIVENIVIQAKSKLDNKLAKQLTGKKQCRLLGIEKLEDANLAGTRSAEQCTLIITEGDSAKSLAMAGLEVVGRDKWGVFPLRGKLLNVRDASTKQIMENKEIENLVKILGLQFNKQYDNTKSLRYGSLMVMTDQDVDGHHIKGLVINLFDRFWPSLLQFKGFLRQFVTPIVKVIAKSGRENEIHSFFSLGDYDKFMEDVSDPSRYKTKYYKGLGTSTDQEGQQYFSNLPKHVKQFKYIDQTDSEYIDLAFSKSKADARKDWLMGYSWESMIDSLDYSQSTIRYKNFITDCLALYSVSDNVRSIPSLIDGLKPTQRKILYTLLSNNTKSEYKVSSLSGLVQSYTNYHHGDASLATTIVSMAQNFPGSNNINLLLPLGQFGTRSQGGKDAAQARYISTKLSPLTLKLYRDEDLHTLKYWEEEGQIVEPTHFIPILPMVLVNGAEGIGTGWMTSVPMYNPREIAEQIKSKLKKSKETFDELTPWWRGFVGSIEFNRTQNSFIMKGVTRKSGDNLFITEIPVKRTPKDVQGLIQQKMQADEPEINELKEHHAGNKVCFEVQFKDGVLSQMNEESVDKYFKLSANININNFVLFDSEGKLKRYNGTSHVMSDFYEIRIKHYRLRLDYLISKAKHDLDLAANKARFLEELLSQKLQLFGLPKKEIIQLLKTKGFTEYSKLETIKSSKKVQQKIENQEQENFDDVVAKNYDYLLSQPIWNVSKERVNEHRQKHNQLQAEYDKLLKQKPEDLWLSDLDEFLIELTKAEKAEEIEYAKRLTKSAEEIMKGGSKIVQSKISQQNLNTFIKNNDSEFDDSNDDSDSEKPKNQKKLNKPNNKFLNEVLSDMANLGLSSKRPTPPVPELIQKKGKEQQMEAEDQEGNAMEVEQKKKENKKQNQKIKQDKLEDDESIVIEAFEEKGVKNKKEKIKKLIMSEEDSNKKQQNKTKKNDSSKKKGKINESDDSISFEVSQKKEQTQQKQLRNRVEAKKIVLESESESEQLQVKPSKQSEQVKPLRKRVVKNIVSDSEENSSSESAFEVKQQQENKKNTKKRNVNSDSDEASLKQPFQKKIQTQQKQLKKRAGTKKIEEEVGEEESELPQEKKKNNKKRVVNSDSEIDVKEIVKEKVKKSANKESGKDRKKVKLSKAIESDEEISKKEIEEEKKPKEKNQQEKLYDKYGLSVFMKYLDEKPAEIQKQKDPTQMSLMERLMLREQEGKIDVYQSSYIQAKEKSKQDSEKKQNLNQKNIDDVDLDDILNLSI